MPIEEFPDQTARDLAGKALARLDTHEAVCLELAKQAADWRSNASQSLQRIESSISTKVAAVYTRINWIIGGLGSAMFTIIILLVGVLLKR